MRRTSTRLVTASAAAALTLFAAACGEDDDGASSATTTSPAAAASASPSASPADTASASPSDTASASASPAAELKLVKAGKLTTCTHLPYAPFQSEKDGKIVGFDVDLIDLAAKKLGLEQEIVDTPFETIKTGADLNAGKCDVAAAGMTITDERKAVMDFSVPYFDATQALLAKKGSGITSLETAKGKKVGSQSGTTGEDFVKKAGLNPVSFEASDAELNALRSGQVEVIVQDLPVVSEWLKDPANKDFEIVANLDTNEQYGFAVKKGADPALLKAINDAITEAKADGTYDQLHEKWLGVKPAKK
jgi:polar amino acid transport system substrate-binding protein